jgi:hypothetical protein
MNDPHRVLWLRTYLAKHYYLWRPMHGGHPSFVQWSSSRRSGGFFCAYLPALVVRCAVGIVCICSWHDPAFFWTIYFDSFLTMANSSM